LRQDVLQFFGCASTNAKIIRIPCKSLNFGAACSKKEPIMRSMKLRHALFLLIVTLLSCGIAEAGLFGPKGKDADEKRDNIRAQQDEMLTELYKLKPEMKEALKKASGYATFKQSDVNLLLVASGNGYGVLVDNRTGKEIFMRVASLGGGIGFGIKDLRVIFVFNDPTVMDSFTEKGWQFGGKADASAKYQDTGVSAEQNVRANVDTDTGEIAAGSSSDVRAGTEEDDTKKVAAAAGSAMEIYQFTESGVSLQATVAGTKYWKDKELND
jgi:lipid-binding SYLF domain-containing protein